MAPLSVLVDGEEVLVRVRRSERARSVRIRVGDFGAEVVLPKRAAAKKAADAVAQHRVWLVKQLSKRSAHALVQAQNEGLVLFRGEWHDPIDLAMRHYIRVPDIERWIRKQALLSISASVADWSTVMGVSPARVSLREQRTKWCACTARGTVTFNWRLVMAPPEVLEYVVVHELAHLRELNHSKRFWAIVEAHYPTWREQKAWLRKHGYLLNQSS